MKKHHIFLSLMLVAMAILVFCGSIGNAYVQALDLRTQASGTGEIKELFDAKGNYAVARTELLKGAKFKFFDHVWRVVFINEEQDIATFWLDEPLKDVTKAFNNTNDDAGSTWKVSNTWCSGYTSSTFTFNGQEEVVGESEIRAYLRELAGKMIDESKAPYKKRVVSGYVQGTNYDNDNAKSVVTPVTFRKSGSDNVFKPDEVVSMTADYSLSSDDRLWLPCEQEVMNDGLWSLANIDRNWDVTKTANAVWLRNPNAQTASDPKFQGTHMGVLVGYLSDVHGYYQSQSFFSDAIDQEYGVRPAIHMSLRNYDGSEGNGGWFNDDIMKVVFIIVCALGIIGVILVIIAVIVKARKNKANPVA